MHRTAFAGTERRARSSCSGRSLGTRALKNRLTGNRATGGRPSSSGSAGLRSGRNRTRRRSFVYRARASLGNDHARSRRLWRRRCSRRGSGTRCRWRDLRSCRSTDGRRSGRGWRDRRRRRRSGGARGSHGSGRRSGRLLNYRRSDCGPGRSRRRNRRGRCWGRSGRRGRLGRRRRRNGRLCRNGRRDRAHDRPDRRRSSSFLLLGNCPQHVSGAGDMRQINLGFDFFFAAQRARGTRRGGLRFGRATDMCPHLFRFMLLDGTGMSLLLGHSDER